MRSEEDTFRKLQRLSYSEIRQIYMSAVIDFVKINGNNAHTTSPIVDFEKYGWTAKEYLAEHIKLRENK